MEEPRCFIGNTDDLVRSLTIEFKIKLSLLSAVVPIAKALEFASPERPLRERATFNCDAHARRLPDYPPFLWDRFGGSDDAARDETQPAFVFTGEDEDRITLGDVLSTIHRLLHAERE